MGCFHWLYLMDMKDASAAIKTQNSGDDITGFADQLASCLVKETIKESGTKIGDQEQEWSIPCSRICHKHSNDTGFKEVVCEAGTSGGVRPSSGHLCWTPETGEGGQEVENQCSDTMGQEDTIRKGVSVPNINVSQASANSDPEHDTTDRLSCSSENSKSHKSRGFLNSLGIKTKHKSDISNSTRPKMKGFKKTLSSLFSTKTRDSTENSSERNKKPTSSKFKLPSVSKRSRAVDPCQRALPPVPPSREVPRDVPTLDDHEDDDNRLGSSLEGGTGGRALWHGSTALDLLETEGSLNLLEVGFLFLSLEFSVESRVLALKRLDKVFLKPFIFGRVELLMSLLCFVFIPRLLRKPRDL